MKKLIWLICLSIIMGLLAGCQTVPGGTTKPTGMTTPETTTAPQPTDPVDIRPLPSENPGSSLIDYDPDRQIYITGENVYVDYYVGITSILSFYIEIYSKEYIDPEDISAELPVELPFLVNVRYQDYIERKTQAMLAPEVENSIGCMPLYVYQSYRGGFHSDGPDLDQLAQDFLALKEADLPEFYVYSVSVTLFNIKDLHETVVLDKLELTIDGVPHEAKLGRVRLLPASEFPTNAKVVKRDWASGNMVQPYNDGLVYLPCVFEMEEVQDELTLTGLHAAEEETQILDILVNTVSGGQSLQMRWDGKSPIYLYPGDMISIDVVVNNPLTETLLNQVYFHTCTEYTNSSGEQLCAVSTLAGGADWNYHEYYAIIFDGVDMEPYYREVYFQSAGQKWRAEYLEK